MVYTSHHHAALPRGTSITCNHNDYTPSPKRPSLPSSCIGPRFPPSLPFPRKKNPRYHLPDLSPLSSTATESPKPDRQGTRKFHAKEEERKFIAHPKYLPTPSFLSVQQKFMCVCCVSVVLGSLESNSGSIPSHPMSSYLCLFW